VLGPTLGAVRQMPGLELGGHTRISAGETGSTLGGALRAKLGPSLGAGVCLHWAYSDRR
jgi:hypothetical protein